MSDRPAAPRFAHVELQERGGSVATLEFGPPNRPIDIVFSHANSFNAWTYRSILADAGKRQRILAYDLRGHGETRLPIVEDGVGWGVFSADLAALLKVLNARDVVLAGHSMGATTSLLAAAEAPEHVRALALFEPVIGPPGSSPAEEPGTARAAQGALRRRSRFASVESALETFEGRGAFATWPRQMVADYAEGGLRRLEDGTYELSCSPEWEAWGYRTQPEGNEVWRALKQAPRPICVLRGGVWSSAAIQSGQELVESCGVAIRTIPGTGHFLPMECPELVIEVLESRMESLRPSHRL
jgi:pimeloyl-ACP methyl ester carboxylesterase